MASADEFEPGDIVRISRLVTVKSKNVAHTGIFVEGEDRVLGGKDSVYIPKWDFELVERPVENWPPQEGDVWSAGPHEHDPKRKPWGEYHCIRKSIVDHTAKLVLMRSDDSMTYIYIEEFKNYPNIELRYRRENG